MSNINKTYWYDAFNNLVYAKEIGMTQPPNTVEIDYTQKELIVNPPLTKEKIIEINEIKAKNLVRSTLNSNITLNNTEFSLQSDFHNFLVNYINSRTSDSGDQLIDWFDSNYIHVQVTLQDLRTLLRTYQERILSTLKKYNEWLQTDRLTAFTIGV